jgi:hypothetical protein
MTKRNIGWLLVIVGTVIQIVSLAADFLGIGEQLGIIGWKQLSGAAIGLIVILIGVWFLSKNPGKTA